jgi:hypothetical protein
MTKQPIDNIANPQTLLAVIALDSERKVMHLPCTAAMGGVSVLFFCMAEGGGAWLRQALQLSFSF